MSHLDLFTAHRRLLFELAYRMLGSVAASEDIVQETWLRWQRQELRNIASPKAWLVATATRLAIDHLRSAQRTREDYYGIWLPEPVIDTRTRSPDESAALADSLTMAFMLMLERLTPDERAVFLLREVFDYDYADIAPIVEKSEAACRQIVSRAKARFGRETSPPTPPSPRAERIVQQFIKATTSGEVHELVALLTDDATLYTDGGGRVRAAGRPIHTADRISRFFVGVRRRYGEIPNRAFRFARVNGRPGALMTGDNRPINAYTFEFDGDRIRAIYLVRNPDKLRHLMDGAN